VKVHGIWVDDELVFSHKGENECAVFDMEVYTLPPVVRKILTLMKPTEIIEITTTRKDKVQGFFIDENFGDVFKVEQLSGFKKQVKMRL
jgi:hypothetical protein